MVRTAITLGVLAAASLCGACESQRSADQQQGEAEAVQVQESDDQADRAEESEESADRTGAAAEESSGEASPSEASETATVGRLAPDFTLTSASGEKHALSDYRGEIVVLEWTSTECPYVERHYEAGTMQKTLERLGGSDEIAWLAIDSSHFATAKASEKWQKKYGVKYPFLLDPNGEVGEMYEAKTTPHMYVIDKSGVLRYKGAIDDDPRGRKESPTNYVFEAVEALQKGKSVEKPTAQPYGCTVKYGG